jgi:hypothetical protein
MMRQRLQSTQSEGNRLVARVAADFIYRTPSVVGRGVAGAAVAALQGREIGGPVNPLASGLRNQRI